MTLSEISRVALLVLLSACRAPGASPVGVDYSPTNTQFSQVGGIMRVNLGGSPVPVGPTLNLSAASWLKTYNLAEPATSDPNLVRVTESLRVFAPISGARLPVVGWRAGILTHGFVWSAGQLDELNLGAIPLRTITQANIVGNAFWAS